MKWLLIFFFPIVAYSAEKRDEYVSGCRDAVQKLVPNQEKVKTTGNKKVYRDELCFDLARYLDEEKKWNLVLNPRREGCSDAIFALSPPELQKDMARRNRMADAICK